MSAAISTCDDEEAETEEKLSEVEDELAFIKRKLTI